MPDEPVEVIVARMDERQKTLVRDVEAVAEAQKDLKTSVDNHLITLQEDVNALKLWKAKIAGIAIGLSVLTGGATAFLFSLIVRALGI